MRLPATSHAPELHRRVAGRLTLAVGGIAATGLMSLVVGQSVPGVPKPVQIVIRIFVLLLAIIVHEVSHGLVAEKLGDPTARRMGRLTLNPVPHIDLFGSIIIPGFLILTGSPFIIGWAKPVPVDIRRFTDPLRGFAFTAMAGPASNFCQVAVWALIFRLAYAQGWPAWVAYLAFSGAAVNLFLAFFNLIPIPPLDGSRLIGALLPAGAAAQYLSLERFGFIIIFGLLWLRAFEPLFNVVWQLLLRILF